MTEKMDRRQLRTKMLLRKTLLELMVENGMEGITVTDISNRADINRGTFYLHYRDVPDMLEQLKDEIFANIRAIVMELDLKEVIEYAASPDPYPKLVGIFEHFVHNADFLKVMFGPKGDISFVIEFKQFMASHIFNKLTYLQPQDDNDLIPRDYLIAYMASANLGVVMHWLESGMKQTPREMGVIMTQIMHHGPLISSRLKKQ